MEITSKVKKAFKYIYESIYNIIKKTISDKRTALTLLAALLLYKIYKLPMRISSSDFIKLVNDNKVSSVNYLGYVIQFSVKNSNKEFLSNYTTNNIDNLNNVLTKHNVHFNHFSYYESLILNPYNQFFALSALFSFLVMNNYKEDSDNRRGRNRNNNYGNGNNSEIEIKNISSVFDAMITSKQNKEQFVSVIDQLINPEKYKFSKIKPVRGILLYGKPGTGKTLVAKVS